MVGKIPPIAQPAPACDTLVVRLESPCIARQLLKRGNGDVPVGLRSADLTGVGCLGPRYT